MRILPVHRKKTEYYLKQFYKSYPHEKYTIFHFVKWCKKRIKLNKQIFFGVTGETGVGKSYGDIMFMILYGRPFSLVKNICYIPKGDEIFKKFTSMKRGCLMIDEAAREMRSVNWQSKSQQQVTMAAQTERMLNNIVFLNLPNFKEMTKSLREGSIQFRVIYAYREETHVRIIVQAKSRNWRSDDPWSDKKADEVYEKFVKKSGEPTNHDILKIERGLPCHVMDFMIPNLALIVPDVVEEYERLKLESREEVKEEEGEKKDLWRDKYNNIVPLLIDTIFYNKLNAGFDTITYTKLSEHLGMGRETVKKLLEKHKENQDKKYKSKPRFRQTTDNQKEEPEIKDSFDKKADTSYVGKEYTL